MIEKIDLIQKYMMIIKINENKLLSHFDYLLKIYAI